MNINPATRGHVLVIPRTHAADIWDLGREDGVAVWSLTQRVAAAVKISLAPDGLSLFQANGRVGWQSVFHFHMHVVPRWEGDGLRPSWDEPSGEPGDVEDAARLIKAGMVG